MKTMQKSMFVLTASVVLLCSLSGCGSSSSSSTYQPGGGNTSNSPGDGTKASTALHYTSSTQSTGWQLVADAASTPTHLILNLVGPNDGTTVRGVGFNLSKGQCVKFGTFPNGGYAMDTGVFQLKGTNTNFEPYAGTDADPVLFVSAPIKSGNVLSTGIFQKDRVNVPKPVNQPLVQVAIDLDTTAATTQACSAGTTIALSVVKAKVIPADIGGMDFTLTTDVINKAKMADISIDVGSLVTE